MYLVTGFLLICLFSRWTEACIQVEIKAGSADQARDRALDAHRRAAEQRDSQATVVWGGQPNAKRIPTLTWLI